jgi:hypothetical protein
MKPQQSQRLERKSGEWGSVPSIVEAGTCSWLHSYR